MTSKWCQGGNWYIRHKESQNAMINLNTESGAAFVLRKLDELAKLKETKPLPKRGGKRTPAENK